jgi:hypothetical protein
MAKCLLGSAFNANYKDKVFIKLTNSDENHKGYRFYVGLNEDVVMYDSSNPNPQGICFCEITDLVHSIGYNKMELCFVRYVRIPDNAHVFVCDKYFRTDKIILSEKHLIEDLPDWSDESFCRLSFGINSKTIKYIKNKKVLYDIENGNNMKSKELADEMEYNGLDLKYVKNQTDEICLAAVKQNGLALEFVQKQTPEICSEAVNNNGLALKFVERPTCVMCLDALTNDSKAWRYVPYEYNTKVDFFAYLMRCDDGDNFDEYTPMKRLCEMQD